jgi:CheY-like chemotaxis protein
MNTRNILLISSDKELSGIIKISALTLTKLNCQVSLEYASDYQDAIAKSKPVNLDLIILDNNTEGMDSLKLIGDIRGDVNSGNKKIILVYTGTLSRDEYFKAGCDSLMNREEFIRVVNNVLVF